jgi:CIC family chloride channel protein
MLLPMLGACFAAMLLPTLLRDAPIYDSLRVRIVRIQESDKDDAGTNMT